MSMNRDLFVTGALLAALAATAWAGASGCAAPEGTSSRTVRQQASACQDRPCANDGAGNRRGFADDLQDASFEDHAFDGGLHPPDNSSGGYGGSSSGNGGGDGWGNGGDDGWGNGGDDGWGNGGGDGWGHDEVDGGWGGGSSGWGGGGWGP